MAKFEIVEVSLEDLKFSFQVVRLPEEGIDDKLVQISTGTGLISRIEYQNFVFTEAVLNLERLFLFILETTLGEHEEQKQLRNQVEELVYTVNPSLRPDDLLFNSDGILKRPAEGREGTLITENADWLKDIGEINPYGMVEDSDLAGVTGGLPPDEIPPPAPVTESTEYTTCKWTRPNLELKIRKYSKADLPTIFGRQTSFKDKLHYKAHIIRQCVLEADDLFRLIDSMELQHDAPPGVLADELYGLCLEVNGFLKFEEIDLAQLSAAKPPKTTKQQAQKKKAGGPKAQKEGTRLFADVPSAELLTLADRMNKKVIGQEEAIEQIVDTIQIASCGLRDPEKPVATYLLCGVTGCGKTLTAKVLAEELCGGRANLVRIDCSEYTQPHEISKLIGCFAPGSPVTVAGGGVKPIEQVAVGDQVVSHQGLVKRVLEKFEYKYKGPLYDIAVVGNDRPVRCTPDHEFWAVKTEQCQYMGRDHVVCKPTCRKNSTKYPCTDKLYEGYHPAWIKAKDLAVGDVVLRPRYRDTTQGYPEYIDLAEFYPRGEWDDSFIWGKRHERYKVPRFIPVNAEFVRLAGYFVAEGCVDNEHLCKRMDFSFHSAETTYHDEVTALVKSLFGLDCSFRTPPRELLVGHQRSRGYVHSGPVRALFGGLFGGHGAENKHLPDWWINLPDDLLREFLTTIIFGDGCTKIPRRVDYRTVSEQLVSQLSNILAKLGYLTNLHREVRPAAPTKGSYRLYVGGEQLHQFQEELPGLDITFGKISNGANGEVFHSNIQRMAYVKEADVGYQIKDIQVHSYKGTVHDIHVEDDVSYMVHGYSVHNSPNGYVGYEEGGFLTNAIQENPFSVVLFDEVEKAHARFFDILLQLLDDARLTDGKGNVTSFKDCIILMTSNIGVAEADAVRRTVGFGDGALLTTDKRAQAIKAALKSRFRPEFLNRIDASINFRSLTREDAEQIVDLMLTAVNGYLKDRDITLAFTDNVKNRMLEKGFSKKFGARSLQRTIDKEVTRPLAKLLLSGGVEDGTTVTLDFVDGKLVVKPETAE